MKVKTDASYTHIIIVLMVGCLALAIYMQSMIFGIIMELLLFRCWIGLGKTLCFHEVGCTVSFLFYKKEYIWDDFVIKRYVEYYNSHDWKKSSLYIAGAEFMPKRFKRPKWLKSATYSELIHPLSFVFVYFLPEEWIKEGVRYYRRFYAVDEKEFKKYMKEWNVQIDKE